jgi:hypothetical protein
MYPAGSSSIDIALEAKNFAQEVVITSRRGTWLMPRFIWNQPYDHLCVARIFRIHNFSPSSPHLRAWLFFPCSLFCFDSCSLLPVFLPHDHAHIGSTHEYVLCRESRAVMALPACFREFFIRHWATFVPHSNEQRNAPLTRYITSAPMRLFTVS